MILPGIAVLIVTVGGAAFGVMRLTRGSFGASDSHKRPPKTARVAPPAPDCSRVSKTHGQDGSHCLPRYMTAASLLAIGALLLVPLPLDRAAAETPESSSASPQAALTYYMSGAGYETLNYSGLQSTDPGDSSAVLTSETVDFGDGSQEVTVSDPNGVTPGDEQNDTPNLSHTYADNNFYNAELWATFTDPSTKATTTAFTSEYVFPTQVIGDSGFPLNAKPAYAGRPSSVTGTEVLGSVTDYDGKPNDAASLKMVDISQQPADGNCALDTASGDAATESLTFTPANNKPQAETCDVDITDDSGNKGVAEVNFKEIYAPAPKVNSSSPRCGEPLTRNGAFSHNGVEDISLSDPKLGENAVYNVRFHPQAKAYDEKTQNIKLDLRNGKSQTYSIKNLTYGEYLETVTNKALQTIVNKLVTVKECHETDPHVYIYKHLEGRYVKYSVNAYQDWKRIRLNLFDDGHKSSQVIEPGNDLVWVAKVPSEKRHQLVIKLGSVVEARRMLGHS